MSRNLSFLARDWAIHNLSQEWAHENFSDSYRRFLIKHFGPRMRRRMTCLHERHAQQQPARLRARRIHGAYSRR